jgi:hypothetical protein
MFRRFHMKRLFLALVCAAIGFLGTFAFAGSNDVYTCEGFAEYHSDASGSHANIRRKWLNVTYKVAPLAKSKGGNDVSVLVIFSGDPALDVMYRQTAPAYSGTTTERFVLAWLSKQPLNLLLAEARIKNVRVSNEILRNAPMLRSDSICWRNGSTPPDRSSWPNQLAPVGNKCREWSSVASRFVETDRSGTRFQCVKELQAYHLRENSDGVKERGAMFFPVRRETNLCGPVTHAESSVEAALRRDAEATGEYHLSGYGGRCWEVGGQKPPNQATWSGHNGAW